ncbi:hypothetical protein GWI33_002085 [Rhynchophorus ferrugineus]|uniref:Cuticle protein 16.5-like n=1 Tax=Rhynchophorus ferrugineus TaxID=354439 RepID=A0A834IVY3_RHYFE|nr:hypothetical protein GWI33_002085 [Rhynchophorus ferrugineus]
MKFLIVFVAVLAVVLGKEAADNKSKRGLFDLGYGYSAPGAIIPAATPVLRTAGGYAAPLPALSYASPAVSYAAPAVSYAAPAVSYAAPPLSYAAVGYSASAPVSYISSSAPIAVPSSAAPAVFARSSSSLLGYNAPAPLLARSVLPSPLSFGYSSARTLIV